MIQKIKRLLFITIASSSLLAPGLAVTLTATAFATSPADYVCEGANNAASGSTTAGSDTSCASSNAGGVDINKVANEIVNVFSVIVGATAIIMIIYGGFRYITSGGDSGRVGTAKNTLIYAIVGLIIVALAQVIVHYVLNKAATSVPSAGNTGP